MKVTILYDNTVWEKGLRSDWGFSCMVEAHGKTILFDTGANGNILRDNMNKLGIDPKVVDDVFISHTHFDHTGGLNAFLELNPVRVFIPSSCRVAKTDAAITRVKEPLEIHDHIFSTGELSGIEQSLVVRTETGVAIIAGCSHPGVRMILNRAARHGQVEMLLGGLHGFREFALLENLKLVCPTHCTQFKKEIQTMYPHSYQEGGAGRVIQF